MNGFAGQEAGKKTETKRRFLRRLISLLTLLTKTSGHANAMETGQKTDAE